MSATINLEKKHFPVLSEARRDRFVPDMVSYNAAVSACEKGRQWEWSLALMSEAVGERLTPNVITLSATITACEKAGLMPNSVRVLENTCSC